MATTTTKSPHVALLPCAGMGHLIPSLRLTAMLSSHDCAVTLITAFPTVSSAESDQLTSFLAIHPNIKHLEFHLLPHKTSNFINEDPFFIQVESICNSIHLLKPLLSSLSPPLSAIVADFPVASSITQLASDLSISTYVVITTSARFFSVMSYLPQLHQQDKNSEDALEVPGLGQVPVSSIPPPMLNPGHFFAANISSNVPSLYKAKGILINTFDSFEPEAVEALSSTPHVAPILPVGPLESFETKEAHDLPWLDEQEPESVLFVSFGSRTALSREQIKELACGLEKSSCRFLWVLKTSKVDKDDREKVEEIVGESFLERTQKQGMVVKGWVNQDQILAHPSIGGFVSHCGWNSVMEATKLGVPILAWPQHGDQRINAEVVERAGLGLWIRDWGWSGARLVARNEISENIIELMKGKSLRARVREVKEKAKQARGVNGTSEKVLLDLIEALKNKAEY